MTVDPEAPTEEESVRLSVVVITEDEEDAVRACIESVFAACRGHGPFEVILVDSASTDRTVERAREYPVTVLRIPDEHTVSCGAGRFAGDQIARGELVLHVDGDMVLRADWLARAIEHLDDPAVAAVEGHLDAVSEPTVREVDKVGGVMLYDAAALAEVGGFDPHLLGYEDVDVGFRLREAGYRLLRIPLVSATHDEADTVTEPVRRWRQGYLFAPGQAIRKWARSPPMLRRLLRRQRYKLGLAAWLFVGAASLLSAPLGVLWLLLSALAFGLVARQRGPAGAVRLLVAKSLGLAGLVVGLGRPTPSAGTYPVAEVEVVAEGPVHEASGATERQ